MRAAALALVVATGCATTTRPAPAPPPPPRLSAAPLHLSGELPAAPPGVGAPGSVVEAVYEVCLDDAGHVASVKPAPGLAAADEAVTEALEQWSWFVVARGARTCWRQRVPLAVPVAGRVLRQASSGVVGHALGGAAPRPAAWLASLYAGKVVDAVYKVCVGDDAVVTSVRSIVPVVGADDAIAATLRASPWEVVVGTLAQAPYCFAAPVHFDLRESQSGAALPPDLPYPLEAVHVGRGVSAVVHLTPLVHPSPHLPDAVKIAMAERGGGEVAFTYRQCVAADGHVASVELLQPAVGHEFDAMAAVLREWRFSVAGPPGVGACQVQRTAFTVTSVRRFN
jgi:hypothetical protein